MDDRQMCENIVLKVANKVKLCFLLTASVQPSHTDDVRICDE